VLEIKIVLLVTLRALGNAFSVINWLTS
jgi:hypothetical protein